MSVDTLKPIVSRSSWADMSEDEEREAIPPPKAVAKESFAVIASRSKSFSETSSPSGSPTVPSRNNSSSSTSSSSSTPKHSPLHHVHQSTTPKHSPKQQPVQRVTWFANDDENTETKVSTPELFDRCVFIVGMQGFNEIKMIELLKTKNINVLELVRMRSHHTKKVKDAFAFAILSNKEECVSLISNKVTLINPHLNPPEQVSFRCVQAWDAREYQDPYTIVVKGVAFDIQVIRSTFAVLGTPQSIVIDHGRAYLEYDNTLAPYLAVEMFDNRKLNTKQYLQVELAKK